MTTINEIRTLTAELLQEFDQLTAEQIISIKKTWEAWAKKNGSYTRVRSFIEELIRVALERKTTEKTA